MMCDVINPIRVTGVTHVPGYPIVNGNCNILSDINCRQLGFVNYPLRLLDRELYKTKCIMGI